ncbi:MAG TPA: (2Fe-2S)-binding protein [Candidatus Binataceae bacterium]|nr:(2Fe-2S)-binding protein [Candidatus Binataceae bacterium]
MIFCHCAAVSDSTIEALIDGGAATVSEISRQCGAGRHCSPCREELKALLSRSRHAQRYTCADSQAAAD